LELGLRINLNPHAMALLSAVRAMRPPYLNSQDPGRTVKNSVQLGVQ
jgi:hypothetical protein